MPLLCTKCPEAWLMDGAQRETPRGPGACKPPPAHISLLLSAPALRPTFFPVIQQSRLMSTSSALCLDLCLTHSSSSRSPCHFLGVAALDHPVWSASSLSTLHHAFFWIFTQLGWKAEVSKLIKYLKRSCVWFILTWEMIQPLGLVLVLFSLLGTGLKSSPESMIIIKNKMGVRERRASTPNPSPFH